MSEVDVVVVGYGAAGMAAALTAEAMGAEVAILEKATEERAGGNTRVSGQVWFAPHDVELAKVYLRSISGEFAPADDVVEAWASETSRNTEWLEGLVEETAGRVERDELDPYDGFEITRISNGETMRQIGYEEAPEHELHEVAGNGCGAEYVHFGPSQGMSRLWLLLKAAVAARGIPVHFDRRATGLSQDHQGRVRGVDATGADGAVEHFGARAGVVLATGGFAANPEMARRYLRLSYSTPWGSPENTGDGIRLAQGLGADLDHPYNYMGFPGIATPPHESGHFAEPPGSRFIYVGADGRRFTNEAVKNRHGKVWVRGEYDFFPGHPMWTVFDEETRSSGPLVWPRHAYNAGWMKVVEHYDWSEDNSVEIDKGWIVRADSVRELAERLGIDPDGLEREVAEFNDACERGRDDRFGRPPETLAPLSRPPYYGYRWAQLLITTLGGLRKDGRARVLDPEGRPIAGLCAAGDVASTYSWALSGGLCLGDAMAFGRLAAEELLGAGRGAEPAATAGAHG
jgi:succinate dehydrogenase/fumarate reductase flavoprotein subunit